MVGTLLAETARTLPREDKARLLIAFLATLALSALLLLVVWACARLTRRYMNPESKPVSTPLPDSPWPAQRDGGEAGLGSEQDEAGDSAAGDSPAGDSPTGE